MNIEVKKLDCPAVKVVLGKREVELTEAEANALLDGLLSATGRILPVPPPVVIYPTFPVPPPQPTWPTWYPQITCNASID